MSLGRCFAWNEELTWIGVAWSEKKTMWLLYLEIPNTPRRITFIAIKQHLSSRVVMVTDECVPVHLPLNSSEVREQVGTRTTFRWYYIDFMLYTNTETLALTIGCHCHHHRLISCQRCRVVAMTLRSLELEPVSGQLKQYGRRLFNGDHFVLFYFWT